MNDITGRPAKLYLIIQREGSTAGLVSVPETYNVEGFVETEEDAQDMCWNLNSAEEWSDGGENLNERGEPTDGALDAIDDGELRWYEWREVNRMKV